MFRLAVNLPVHLVHARVCGKHCVIHNAVGGYAFLGKVNNFRRVGTLSPPLKRVHFRFGHCLFGCFATVHRRRAACDKTVLQFRASADELNCKVRADFVKHCVIRNVGNHFFVGDGYNFTVFRLCPTCKFVASNVRSRFRGSCLVVHGCAVVGNLRLCFDAADVPCNVVHDGSAAKHGIVGNFARHGSVGNVNCFAVRRRCPADKRVTFRRGRRLFGHCALVGNRRAVSQRFILQFRFAVYKPDCVTALCRSVTCLVSCVCRCGRQLCQCNAVFIRPPCKGVLEFRRRSLGRRFAAVRYFAVFLYGNGSKFRAVVVDKSDVVLCRFRSACAQRKTQRRHNRQHDNNRFVFHCSSPYINVFQRLITLTKFCKRNNAPTADVSRALPQVRVRCYLRQCSCR